MYNMPLEQEHKDKLLEMIVFLFPNYIRPQINNKVNLPYIRFYEKVGSINLRVESHWFEFVMCYLVGKLAYMQSMHKNIPMDNLPYAERQDIWFVVWSKLNCGMAHGYKEHPIDYLYKKFLQIEK